MNEIDTELNKVVIGEYMRISKELGEEVFAEWDSKYLLMEQWFSCLMQGKWQRMVEKN